MHFEVSRLSLDSSMDDDTSHAFLARRPSRRLSKQTRGRAALPTVAAPSQKRV